MRLNKIQKTAVSALEDIKARDIIVLDVRKLTSLYDTMIVATAESSRQVNALAHHGSTPGSNRYCTSSAADRRTSSSRASSTT